MTAKNPYRAGSPQDLGAYIEREADQRLRKELAENRRFPFVFAPPDSGKSSLLKRTLTSLDAGQHCGMVIDLAQLRLNDYTLFTGELLTAIAHFGDFDSREIAADCPEDTFVAWLGTFPQRLIVLLDSCELLHRASFGEQFLGKLKFLLNVRAENEEFSRLQFVLASAMPMGRLVPTHLQTPYTTEILLPLLSPSQVDTLTWHLGSAQVDVDAHVGAVLYRHTAGVPYLCQHILALLWDEAIAAKAPVTVAQLNQLVDRGIERAAQNEHLAELFRVITQSPTMLDTFLRLRRGLTVDPQRMQELVSTGLCDYDQPYRCGIYERVYGPGGALDLTRAATLRGAAEPSSDALTEPPRPPRPTGPRASQPPVMQLLPEGPRPPRQSEPRPTGPRASQPPVAPQSESLRQSESRPTGPRASQPPVAPQSDSPRQSEPRPTGPRASQPPVAPQSESRPTGPRASQPPVAPQSESRPPGPRASQSPVPPLSDGPRSPRPSDSLQTAPQSIQPPPVPPLPEPPRLSDSLQTAPNSILPEPARLSDSLQTAPQPIWSEPSRLSDSLQTAPQLIQPPPMQLLPEPPRLPAPATSRSSPPPVQLLPEPPRLPRQTEPPLPTPGQPAEVQLLPEPPRLPRQAEPPLPTPSPPAEVQLLPEPPRLPRQAEPPLPTPSPPAEVQLLPEPPRPAPTPAVPVTPPVPLGALTAAGASANNAEDDDDGPVIEFSNDDEQTVVDETKRKLGAHHDAHTSDLGKPSPDDLRTLLEDQLFLVAELDAFCNHHFPAIVKQFKPGMTRAERTNLLLGGAEPTAIVERLKEWEGSLEHRQEVVAAVVTGSSPLIKPLLVPAASAEAPPPLSALAEAPAEPPHPPALPTPPGLPVVPPPETPTPLGLPVVPPPEALTPTGLQLVPPPLPPHKSTPPVRPSAAEPPPTTRTPVPEPPAFREPTAVLSVGVGLVLANRYFLTSEVGHGAVAAVWNAYDRIKDEQVALKLLHGAAADNPVLVQRFWQSAQQQASLSHPAIVGVLNKPREESGIHYVVMEYVPAGNLRNWVLNSKLTRTQLLRLMQRLGSALQYAHERKILHRNVKPTNILFDTTGHARLVDFGLQWPADASTDTQSRLDRVIYMAPEEQLGDTDGDPRSDVYSLGMCALFALHGKELPSLVMQERASFIEQLEVPPALKAVVKRAVAMNAAERFGSAAEFCRALEVDAPALPGISVRNSDARNPERRSSAEDLRTIKSEPSQRLQVPALTTGNHPVMSAPIVGPPTPQHAPPPSPPPPPPAVAAPRPTPQSSPAPTPPPPAVVPVAAAPVSLTSTPAPVLLPVLPPPRPRLLERDNDEIPPTPGRNPITAAQYVIPTEKVPAVGPPSGASRSGPVNLVPMLAAAPPKGSAWRSLAFATLGLLVISGGVLAYLFGTMPSDSPGGALVAVQDPNGNPSSPGQPVVEALNDPARQNPLTAPVIPLQPPEKTKPSGNPRAEGKPATRPENGTKVAAVPVPGKPEGRPDGKTDPGAAAKTPGGTKVAKLEPGLAGHPGPTSPAGQPPTTVPPATTPKAVALATKPSIPIIAAKQQAKTWEVVALNEPGSKPAPAPRVEAGTPPPPVAVTPVTPPPHPAATPKASTNVDAEAILREAQTAFVHGDRQGAIAAALRVTHNGGEEAIKAWRFVGGAACSGKLAPQATSAYHNLRDPDHKRLLVELCQRNGLHFADGAFSVPEE